MGEKQAATFATFPLLIWLQNVFHAFFIIVNCRQAPKMKCN